MNRVSVFIDHSNVFQIINGLRKQDPQWVRMYDPLMLAQSIVGNRELVKIYFYYVPPPAWLLQEGPDGIHKHARASQYYAAVSKLDKVEMKYGYLTGDKSAPNEKNVDTQICADMVTSAALGEFDTAILVSSDGDFQSAITNSKKLGKRVEILFFKGHCSGALRQMCDLARKARRSHFTKITGV